MTNTNRSFNVRGFSSLLVGWAFVLLTLSGFILYAAPRGAVATRIEWTLLGFDRHQWSIVHTSTAILFILAAVFHMAYNFRVFVRHCLGDGEGRFPVSRELMISLAILALVLGAIWMDAPPMRWIHDVRHEMRDRYEVDETRDEGQRGVGREYRYEGEDSRGRGLGRRGDPQRRQGGPARPCIVGGVSAIVTCGFQESKT